MSTTINLPVLLAQLPHLAKVASTAQSAAKTQGEFAEELAREQDQRAKDKVQEVEQQEKPDALKDEDERGGTHPREAARRRRAKEKEEAEPEPESAPRSPWAGNIVNIKI